MREIRTFIRDQGELLNSAFKIYNEACNEMILYNCSDTVVAMDEAFDGEVPVAAILQHVLELQRLDTQEQIAKNSATTTLFVPYKSEGDDVEQQILRGNLASRKTADNEDAVSVIELDEEERKAG